MNLTNTLKDKCTLQTKSVTSGALGDVETWSGTTTYWCRKVPVDVKTITAFMQLNTEVDCRFILGGELTIELGNHRIIHKGKTYELVTSAQDIEGNTSVLVKEV